MPVPSRRGISTRQRQHKQPPPPDPVPAPTPVLAPHPPAPPLKSTQNPTIPPPLRNPNNTQELPKEQKIPNPLPPITSIGHKLTSISAPPFPLLDYEYYNENEDDVDDCDIIVHDSDDQADGKKSRNERLRRVHTYALRYLAGDRVYIHCARLRGPVVDNPWKKKLKKESEVTGQSKRRVGQNSTGRMASSAKRRRLMEVEDEVLATPTQKSKGVETIEDAVVVRRGPRRKQAMPKKVTYEEEEEEEEGENKDEDEKDEENVSREEGGELLATDHEMGEVSPNFQSNEVVGRGKQTSTRRGKANPPPKTGRKTQNTKTARNRVSKNTGLTQQKMPTTASRRWKTSSSQENAAQKPTRKRGVRGGREVAPQVQAAALEGSDGEDEAVEENSVPKGRKNRKAVQPNVGQSAKAGKRGTSTRRTLRPTGQKRNTVSRTPTKPSVDPPDILENEGGVELPAEFPDVPVTPVANLRFEDPTPPSVFYGPGSNNLHNIPSKANLANKFFAVRQETSQPAAKPSGSKTQAISAGKTKPTKAESASTAAAKKATNNRVTRSNAAVETGIGRSKRKASPVMPDEEGDANEAVSKDAEGQVDNTNEWIPGSSDFKYKRGAGKAAAVRNRIAAEKAAAEEVDKGKGKAKEDTTVQQSKPKKPRVVDFAALSPFGGGQVVSRSGKIYTGDDEEGESNMRRTPNDGIQNQNNARIPQNTPLSSGTPREKPNSARKDDKTLQKIPSDAHSSKNITGSSVTTANTAAAKKPTPATSKGAELQDGQFTRNPTTVVTQNPSVVPISGQQQLSQVEQGAFVVPPVPAIGAETQSPLVSTQRQLSAARKGFISILDTPVPEQETPVKLHSSGLSRLRKGPEFGLAKDNDGAEMSPFTTTRPGYPQASFVLMPETPAQAAAKGHTKPSQNDVGSSEIGVVPDTSPPGPTSIWARHRRAHNEAKRNYTNRPTGPSAFTSTEVVDTAPPSLAVTRSKGSNAETIQQGETVPPPVFSPFKTLDTPTKSQFGSFMKGFSPLRYSPDRELETIEESQSQSPSRSQSQSNMAPIRLFGDPTSPQSKNSKDTSAESKNRQRANPSAWLGLSQGRTSKISLFQSSPGTPAQRPAPLSSPALGSSPPQAPPTESSPPILPKSLFSPSQGGAPSTPRFRKTSSSQFVQNSMPSPGTKLAGDMLELMGGGIWDMDNELSKMNSDDNGAAEAGGSSSKFTTPVALGKGKLGIGKGLFGSGSKKFGGGSGTRRR